MPQMTISEPTTAESARAEASAAHGGKFASVFARPSAQFAEAGEAQVEADFTRHLDAPDRPPEPDRDAPPVWGLPRINPSAGGWLDSTAKAGVVPKEGFLKLSLVAETVGCGSHLVESAIRDLEVESHTAAHAGVLASEEYKIAAGTLPPLARAERGLKAATAKLEALAGRKAKLTAKPPADLGKQLVAIEAERVALTGEAAEYTAERDALAPAARSASAALARVAERECRAAHFAMKDARLKSLAEKTAAFFAEHSERLTELAVLSAVRSPREPSSAAALVRMLEADLVAAPAAGE